MKKSTIIIITIISVIISVISMLLSYFGVYRYLSLRKKSHESFLTNYKNLSDAKDNGRVIVVFTTTPDKISKIKPMINSILDQSVKVSDIELIIPDKYNNKKYNIPDYIRDVATIIPSGRDYGEGTAIIPCLFREKDSDAIIIVVKDNIIYGKDFVEKIVEETDKNPSCVLTDKNDRVMVLKPSFYDANVIDNIKEYYDSDWFINHCDDNKFIELTETYSYM